jgi:hypothetical protein
MQTRVNLHKVTDDAEFIYVHSQWGITHPC